VVCRRAWVWRGCSGQPPLPVLALVIPSQVFDARGAARYPADCPRDFRRAIVGEGARHFTAALGAGEVAGHGSFIGSTEYRIGDLRKTSACSSQTGISIAPGTMADTTRVATCPQISTSPAANQRQRSTLEFN